MGEIINVRCKACKNEWQCFTGNGLLHGRRDHILAAFSEEKRQQAERLLTAREIPDYTFQYRPAVCGHCQVMTAVPVLRAADGEETCVGLCPRCGREVKNYCEEEQDVEKWSKMTACPVCKKKMLQAEDGGYWD